MDIKTYVVEIDPKRTLGDLVAAGKYDRINFNAQLPRFAVPDPANRGRTHITEVAFDLVLLGKALNTQQVEHELTSLGRPSATIAEILALGERYPDLQREFRIVALSSSWVWINKGKEYRNVPVLRTDLEERKLIFRWTDPEIGWFAADRFVTLTPVRPPK